MTNRIWQNDGKTDFATRLPMARTERTYERTNARLQDTHKNTRELNAGGGVDKR